MSDYKAYIIIREFETNEEVSRIGIRHLGVADKVMMGLLINMDTERFYADDSQVDEALKAEGE